MIDVGRPIGRLERLAYDRSERDHEFARKPGGHPKGLYFDDEASTRPIEFIEKYCRHHKGEWAGRPLLLEPWEKFCVRETFGWKLPSGLRRFRTTWLEVARKNGKTELAAAIGLYLLIADHEPGAEIYSTATKKDQARIVWDAAKEMVAASKELRKFVRTYRSSIVCGRLGSKFEPLSADSDTLDGPSPHGHIADEVHAHKDNRVWAVLDTGLGARRQPLTLGITTAGVYRPDSIGWEQHDYAVKILEQVFEDDSFFAFICAADPADERVGDPGDDLFSELAQRKANPNYGVSVKPDYLQEQAKKAQRQPSFLNEYLRLHLNLWTQQAKRWLSVDHWRKCNGAPLDLEKLAGLACYGGLDLSSKLDLAAFVLAWPVDGMLALLCRFWIPENQVKAKAEKGLKSYENWVRAGHLIATPGDVIDYKFIRREIVELGQQFQITEIAYDPWNATQIATELGEQEGFQMVEVRQGYKSLSEPSKDFEARTVAGKIWHASNPVMLWCVSNAVTSTDAAGNIKPDKQKASEKIDGVVAAIMANSRAMLERGGSAYDEAGIEYI